MTVVYFVGFDHTPARLAQAESAVQAAVSSPTRMLGKRTSRARKIFIGDISIMMVLWLNWKLPRRSLPNRSASSRRCKGYIERRQGRWNESTARS